MKTIRTASGLGDSTYLIPPIKYLSQNGEQFGVLTHWRDIYTGVAQPLAYDRNCAVDIDATYVTRRSILDTNQFEDVCIRAGINERIEFDHAFSRKEREIQGYKHTEKPLCLIRWPYYREGKGQLKNGDLVPPPNIMQAIVDTYKHEYEFVNIGNGVDKTVEIRGVTDLTGKTNLGDILYLVHKSDMIITQCGMLLPFGEIQSKRVFVIFPEDMNKSEKYLVQTATPKKVICKGSTEYTTSRDVDKALEKFRLYRETVPYKNQVTWLQIDREIRGKRVVVTGSAPSVLQNDGDEIDRFDTIVRANGTDNDIAKYGDKIGHRTDIHYSFYGTSVRRTVEGLKKERVKYLWSKIPYANYTPYYKFYDGEPQGMLNFRKYFDNFRFAGIPIYLPKIKDLMKECKVVDRMMTSGVSAIRSILQHEPKELYITGFTFFDEGIHNIDEPHKLKAGGHKSNEEREYVKKLAQENKCIRVDKKLSEIFR